MEPVDRRDFIKTVAGAAAFAALEGRAASPPEGGPVFLSTWTHGKPANERAAEVFKSGGSLLDAVEKGINVPESDPNVTSVGYGGIPNAEGVVELDAAIMDGARHRASAVCNLHIKHPISVARLVMEKTRHTTLAGEGVDLTTLEGQDTPGKVRALCAKARQPGFWGPAGGRGVRVPGPGAGGRRGARDRDPRGERGDRVPVRARGA